MPDPSDSRSSLADYKASVGRLVAAREKATVERERVVESGDPQAGERNIAFLKAALDECKEVRQRLSPQDLFVVEYNVEVAQPHRVSLVLPKGTSWLEYFERAQDVSRRVWGRDIVYQGLLDTWIKQKYELASSRSDQSTKVQLELCVEGSQGLDGYNQSVLLRQRGLEPALGIHVLAGYVATFFVPTDSGSVGKEWNEPFLRVADGYVCSAGHLGVYYASLMDEDTLPHKKIWAAGQPIKGKSARE